MTKIAIIEDDKDLASRLTDLFREEKDFELVGVFPDAESFLEEADKSGELFLVDLKLPGKSGAELIALIKDERPDVVCVAHTVVTDRSTVLKALRAGADGYLVKGLSGSELLTSLRTLDEGGAPLTSQVARLLVETFHSETTLSPRENEVLQLVAEGHSYKQAAAALHLSVHTIHDHVKSIYQKLNVKSRGEAVKKARRLGWIS